MGSLPALLKVDVSDDAWTKIVHVATSNGVSFQDLQNSILSICSKERMGLVGPLLERSQYVLSTIGDGRLSLNVFHNHIIIEGYNSRIYLALSAVTGKFTVVDASIRWQELRGIFL